MKFWDWLKACFTPTQFRHMRSFLLGQEAVADEFDALVTERSVAAKTRGLEVTLEGLDHANRLQGEAAQDEARAACVAAYKESLVEMTRNRARLLPAATPEEIAEALEGPFVGVSNSAIPSGGGSPPKALGNRQADATPPSKPAGNGSPAAGPQPPRGRGRPTKEEAARRKALTENGTPPGETPSPNGH